jgi:predicted SnoaL-like aldol condensation-catalyzing enzyme
MIAKAWLLAITLTYSNGQQSMLTDHYAQKEECVYAGKMFWHRYWTGTMKENSTAWVKCENRREGNQLIVINCDQLGVCNV